MRKPQVYIAAADSILHAKWRDGIAKLDNQLIIYYTIVLPQAAKFYRTVVIHQAVIGDGTVWLKNNSVPIVSQPHADLPHA